VKPETRSKAPIMVNAILDQETFHQASTITRAARIALQKQNAIFSSAVIVIMNKQNHR
jgi:hypothetical protein